MKTMAEHLQYLADEIKKIEEFAKDLQSREYWDEYYPEVEKKVSAVKKYAKENGVPVFLDADDIAEAHYEGEKYRDESSYYEEESSSW